MSIDNHFASISQQRNLILDGKEEKEKQKIKHRIHELRYTFQILRKR